MNTIRTNYEYLHTVEYVRWKFDDISARFSFSHLGVRPASGAGVPPFQVPKLWTFGWAERMGLEKPMRHRWSQWWEMHKSGEGMDKLGSIEGLMWDRRKRSKDDEKIPQMRVYITEHSYGRENGPQVMGHDWMGSQLSFRQVEAQGGWDRAFVDVAKWFCDEADHDM